MELFHEGWYRMSSLSMFAALMSKTVVAADYYKDFSLGGFDTGDISARSNTSPSIAWIESAARLQIWLGNLSNLVAWDKWGSFSGNYAFESAVTVIYDGSGRSHFGLYLEAGDSGQHGYRVFHLDNKWAVSLFVDNVETTAWNFNDIDRPVQLGVEYVIRVEIYNGFGSLYVDGDYIGAWPVTAQPSLRPGWFTYGNSGGTTMQVRYVQVDHEVRPPSPKHRYWRIFITANNGSDRVAIQELELYTPDSPTTDITNPSMATSFSTFATYSGPITGIIDNNFTDYGGSGTWATSDSSFPQWAAVDLGAGNRQQVSAFQIWPQNYNEGGIRSPKDFSLQWSDDNATWTDAKAFSGITGWVNGTGKYFDAT